MLRKPAKTKTTKSKSAKAKPAAQKPLSAATRMSAYRRRMREAGLRPVQIWVPDTKSPEFIAKCRAEARALAKYDPGGDEIMREIMATYEWPE